MRPSRVLWLLVMLSCASSVFAQSAVLIQKALTAEGERLRSWAADKVLLDATRAQNGRKVSLAEIQKIDDEWKAGKVRKEIMAGACADRLRQLASEKSYYIEVFVTDNQGALVCANEVTSDYWQGDEPKWTRSFNDGQGRVFIDRPRFDESAKATLGTISVPMMDGDRTIGVVTIGVITDKLPPG
jgi:hypothetical protein